MTDKKKEKPAEPIPVEVDFMVTLPHGEGHEVSFHPEHVFLVDSAGQPQARPGGGTVRTTKVQLSDGKVTALYNAPLPKQEVDRRIRAKLELWKADHALSGVKRNTVQAVVDAIGRQVMDQMDAMIQASLDRTLPERMQRFLVEFSRGDDDAGDEAGKEAPGGTEAP